MKAAVRILIPLLVLLLGYAGMKQLSKGEAEEEEKTGRRGMGPPGKRQTQKVEGILLERTDYQVVLSSQGVVRAHNTASLTPRVAGRVMRIHPSFETGSFFEKGTVLLELDPSDFETAVASAEAQLARAEAALMQEEARAEQAALDWDTLDFTDPPTALVLRKPQLKEAAANLKAANAALNEARRELIHTKVLSPYDGCVLSRNVGPGQSVGSNTTLGSVFSTDFAEIRLPLNAEDLKFIELSNGELQREIPVTLIDAIDPASPLVWTGRLMRSEGVLDASSRELFLVARVEDPYGLQSGAPPLRIGQPVTARIKGSILPNVFVIPRTSLREPNQVVLVNPEDSTVARRKFTPIWSAESELVIEDGLESNWWLVTSSLPYAANGSKVEVVAPKGEEEADPSPPQSAQTPEHSPGA